METTLEKVKIGSAVKVKKITADGKLRRRLLDMGVTIGTEIYTRKVAPFGDPIEITLRGYELTLRKAEAEHIIVKDGQ